MTENKWPMPSQTNKPDGTPRQVGVEFELQGLEVKELAEVTASSLNAEIERVSDAEYLVKSTQYGDFRIEIDYALLKRMARDQAEQPDDVGDIDRIALEVLTDASMLVVPCEVVTPPLPMQDLQAVLEPMVRQTRDAGAKGTDASFVYAFGLHLNIEPPAMAAENVLALLKGFVCLYDWLLWSEDVDLSRRATPYISRYPGAYEDLLIDPDYWPDWSVFIDDYLEHNPTRNRAMDMLPMFASVDEDRVRNVVDDDRVKARPAFHYRLANCRIDVPDWSIAKPWVRWLQVEALASDRERLNECCRALQADRDRVLHRFDSQWLDTVKSWLADPESA